MTTTSSSTNESIRPKNNHTTISTTGVSTTLDQTTTTSRFRNNYDDNNNSVISKDSSTFAYVVNRSKSVLKKYGSFVGPGMLISVAYMDPGNYATGITAGHQMNILYCSLCFYLMLLPYFYKVSV